MINADLPKLLYSVKNDDGTISVTLVFEKKTYTTVIDQSGRIISRKEEHHRCAGKMARD